MARRYPLHCCVKEQDGRSSFLQERQWEVRWARSGGDSSLQSLYCQVEREEKERGKGAVKPSCGLLQACTNPSLASCLSEE